MGSGSSKAHFTRLEYGSQAVQGRRQAMEDAVLIDIDHTTKHGIFAVFDGHNGRECSNFLQKQYLSTLKPILSEAGENELDIKEIMKRAALEVDLSYLKMAKKYKWQAGSTGIVAYFRGDDLYVSNTGDSRAVAIVNGEALPMSIDQKPEHPEEKKRIESSGGSVIQGRIQGQLAMARAFGNPELKKQNYLIADPDVTHITLDDNFQYLIIATDGLWDVVSVKKAAKLILDTCDNSSPSELAEALALCALQRGSMDNISVIVVKLNAKKSRDSTSQEKRSKEGPPLSIPSRQSGVSGYFSRTC